MRLLTCFSILVILAGCAPGATTTSPTASTVAGPTTQAVTPGLEPFRVEPLPQAQRWRVAIPDFRVAPNSIQLRGEQLQERDPAFYVELGSGVADIFSNEAFRSGQFVLTERAEISKVLREQDLALSGRVDPQTAADAGRIMGAELIILGSLSEFSVSSTGGGGRILGLFGGSAEVVTARVSVDIRFVDAVTAEVVAIGSSTSEVSQQNVQIDVFNIIQGLRAGTTGTTIVDLAVRNAIRGAISDAAQNLPRKSAP